MLGEVQKHSKTIIIHVTADETGDATGFLTIGHDDLIVPIVDGTKEELASEKFKRELEILSVTGDPEDYITFNQEFTVIATGVPSWWIMIDEVKLGNVVDDIWEDGDDQPSIALPEDYGLPGSHKHVSKVKFYIPFSYYAAAAANSDLKFKVKVLWSVTDPSPSRRSLRGLEEEIPTSGTTVLTGSVKLNPIDENANAGGYELTLDFASAVGMIAGGAAALLI